MLVARELLPSARIALSPDEEAQPRKLSIPAGKSVMAGPAGGSIMDDGWREVRGQRFPAAPMSTVLYCADPDPILSTWNAIDDRNWRAFFFFLPPGPSLAF